jgi:hypothetical protein
VRLLARLFGWLRRRPQQEVLGEDDAYERCHGGTRVEVRVLPKELPKPRVLPRLAGDYLRRCFEERLEGRRAPRAPELEPLELLRPSTSAPDAEAAGTTLPAARPGR